MGITKQKSVWVPQKGRVMITKNTVNGVYCASKKDGVYCVYKQHKEKKCYADTHQVYGIWFQIKTCESAKEAIRFINSRVRYDFYMYHDRIKLYRQSKKDHLDC